MTTHQNGSIELLPIPTHPAATTNWQALGTLPEGSLDIIGDIHGEIDALSELMTHLGYSQCGAHPQERHLVFLGDLIDRGPDSPGVVRWVTRMIEKGYAVAVMGNHDLNAISRREKRENPWLFGHDDVSPAEKAITCDDEREEILGLLAAHPVARERSDLRVVHACWNDEALQLLAGAAGANQSLQEHRVRIRTTITPDQDEVAKTLAHQNGNPMKLITSGPEIRAAQPYLGGGKMRTKERDPWWKEYNGDKIVVFGHYWRLPAPTLNQDGQHFAAHPLNSMLGKGKAICIDFSVGARASERAAGRVNGPFSGRLGALRWPERELVFDNGERQTVVMPASAAFGE